jgi:Cu-Zn family superoxide dismutase
MTRTARLAAALFAGALPWGRMPSEILVELGNAQGMAVGRGTVTGGVGQVALALDLWQLPPGLHGFHIHEVGRCELPDFSSAGGHFNPGGTQHGHQNPQGPHAGDLPNLMVRLDGTAKGEIEVPGVTLGDGPRSLIAPSATSLVIHANPDDGTTDPEGNAGGWIACGVTNKRP